MRRTYPSIASIPFRSLPARGGRILSAVLLFCASAASAAPDFSRFLAPDTLVQLGSQGRMTHFFRERGILTLCPAGPSRTETQRDIDAMAPTVGVEILLLHRSPTRAAWDTPAGELELFNGMRSMSALKGLTYWSSSRKRQVTLFRDSYVIDSPQRQRRTEDPLVRVIPETDEIFVVQDDTTFGRNVYRASYRHRDGTIGMKIENIEPVSLLFLPVVRPGNLVFRFLLAPSGDSLVFWGACYLRLEIPVGGRAELEDSLMHRLAAMVDWAVARMR